MISKCSYCGQYVSFPCETLCEQLHCGDKLQFPSDAPTLKMEARVTVDAGSLSSAVHHPQHYARWKMEPVEFIAINDIPWWLANVIKYTMRYDAKDGLKDLYKARAYLDMKIREIEGHDRFWDMPVAEERKLHDRS